MSRAERIFRNQSGKTYMTRQIIGRRVNESEEDLYNDIDDRDEDLTERIQSAVRKLNNIRQQCINIDPNYDEELLNPAELAITERTLDSLYDMIEDEKRLLDAYMQEADDDDEFDADAEPDAQDLEAMPDDFEDITDDELFDEPENLIVHTPTNYDEDSDEARFLRAMDAQLKYGEEERDVFWLSRKSEPDVDFLVTVITKFPKDNSFFFNILKVDDEECNKTVRIPLNDIDLENTEFDNLSD